MGRRPISERVPCAEASCPEVSWREHESQREWAEDRKRQRARPWRCLRHQEPDEVLSSDSAEKTGTLTVYEESYGRFWQAEPGKSGSGIESGPGFKAFAKDFPPGTRLIVTARIELPAGVGVEDGETT